MKTRQDRFPGDKVKATVASLVLVSLTTAATAGSTDEITEQQRETVSKGLEFLVKHQHKDGHWEGDEGKHPVTMTALAGMALMMEGNHFGNHLKGKFSANIERGVDWLINCSEKRRDGLIYSGHSSETDCYMYAHALATQFLAWQQLLEDDEDRSKKGCRAVCAAVNYIADAQSSCGGWYRTSRKEGHDLDEFPASLLQLRAIYFFTLLKQKHPSLETKMTAQSYADGQAYLGWAMQKHDLSSQSRKRVVETVAALACNLNRKYDEQVNKWVKYCESELLVDNGVVFGRDELTHYFLAQFAESTKIDAAIRKSYRAAMLKHLSSTQNQDGSWSGKKADDPVWNLSTGAVYATAVWSTVLQMGLPNHPLVIRSK